MGDGFVAPGSHGIPLRGGAFSTGKCLFPPSRTARSVTVSSQYFGYAVTMKHDDEPQPSASLPVRFVIYLPTASERSPVRADVLEDVVARILCEHFGGVTAYPAKGTFASASGTVQTEPIMVLETYCDRASWQSNQGRALSLVRLLARILRQEVVASSVDGKMLLIDRDVDGLPQILAEGVQEGELYALLHGVFE